MLLPTGLAVLIVIGIPTSRVSVPQLVSAARANSLRSDRITLPMSKNGLLLLIAGLAVLVAIGILTG